MDDDKKYTQNENESESENENKNNQANEFDDFDFTDEFPEEFSADFTTKNKDTDEEDDLFSSSFDTSNEVDEFPESFSKQPAAQEDDFFTEASTDEKPYEEDPFASFENKEADEFVDPFAPKEPVEDDFFSTPYDKSQDDFSTDFEKKNIDDDFFSQDFATQNTDESDPFAQKFNPESDFDDDFLRTQPLQPEAFDADNQAIPPEPTQNKGNILRRHPFIALFLIVVLIFGGYRLMQRGGEGEITPVAPIVGKAEQKPLSVAAPAAQQMDQRLQALEQGMLNISEQLQIMQGSNVRLEQMEQMVTKIAEEERDLAATLAQLEALSHQVNTLTQLAQQMSALDAQVKMIAGDVDLYTTVSEQTQRAANLSRQALQAKSMMPVPMVVQAAIPGRAWLLSEFGELITVARGDEVPGYGRVLNIDPVAGTVTMSSEAVFREER